MLLLTERHYLLTFVDNFYPEMKKYCNMLVRHDHALREILHQMYMLAVNRFIAEDTAIVEVSPRHSELGKKMDKIHDDLNELAVPIHTRQLQMQVMKFMKENIPSEVSHFSDYEMPIPTSALGYASKSEDQVFLDASWFYRTTQREFWDTYLPKPQAQKLFDKSYINHYQEVESRRHFHEDRVERPRNCCTLGVGDNGTPPH